MRDTSTNRPLLSFAIPVRNGEAHIRRLIDSILAQGIDDIEIVFSDNASTDQTAEIVQEYQSRDPRFRYFRNEEDIGQLENFNRVFELSRGRYFRWIGVDDWLEPGYARKCLNLLENNPYLAGVTTNTVLHHEDDGRAYYLEYTGERLESKEAYRRFVQMLWLLSKGQLYCCPISSLFRRETLKQTHLFQVVPHTDVVMAAELSLVGPFGHVSEPLVHRIRPAGPPTKRAEIWKRYYPRDSKKVQASYWKACRVIRSSVWNTPLTLRQKLICSWAIARFLIKNLPIEIRQASKLRVILLLPQDSWLRKRLDKGKCGACEKQSANPASVQVIQIERDSISA
jgi:glycosyltransferase involved in cell wall biosynthesis